MKNYAPKNNGVLACKACFDGWRAKNEPPCKATEAAVHGIPLGECAQCADPAEYRAVFFRNGRWE